jgi:hypothetical protein
LPMHAGTLTLLIGASYREAISWSKRGRARGKGQPG